MTKERNQVPLEDKWNVEALYPNYDAWLKDLAVQQRNNQTPRWPEISNLQNQLGKGPEVCKTLFDHLFSLDRALTKLYTYAHLRHDENIADNTHKEGLSRIMSLLHEFSQAVSWIEPEFLSLSDETLDSYLKSDLLKEYRFHLEKIIRQKKHTLSAEQEELLALAAKALQTSSKAFGAINDADFDFGTVKDCKGQDLPLTHASYGLYLRSQDRSLRENSFKELQQKYMDYENTLCELLNGQAQKHLFLARARKYENCLEAALFPKNIDVKVYHALIEAVNQNLGALHKYIALREKIMNVGPLHLFDMYVPLTSNYDLRLSFDEAVDLIIESVAPLGEEYQSKLKEGLKQGRWVDRYENKNKRSGGYSSGCYDSMPYILMNYKGILRDVFTLAHEAGHSMHSLLSRTHQPYQYADYPIFLAEVASTFNEELLMQHLLSKSQDKEQKIYLINEKIEDIRATLFRQTMFAEFELLIHTLAEHNEPITPARLKEEYLKLNKKYFGPSVIVDEEAQIEWARIPHFYYNFYVYQYATGVSAALALADKVRKGGAKERDDYLSFLKSGCSKYPVETLRNAGVDMSTPEPVKSAIDKFSALVDQLEDLMADQLCAPRGK